MIDVWGWVVDNIRIPPTRYMTPQTWALDESDFLWNLSRDMMEVFDD